MYDEAIADFSRALKLNPNYAAAHNSLAFLLATCADEKYRDGHKAVESALKACQLTEGRNWGYTDTLAAAYAESGDFEKAKQFQAKAIELAPSKKSKQDCGSRLELYEQGKPFRK